MRQLFYHLGRAKPADYTLIGMLFVISILSLPFLVLSAPFFPLGWLVCKAARWMVPRE